MRGCVKRGAVEGGDGQLAAFPLGTYPANRPIALDTRGGRGTDRTLLPGQP